jgi:hypothetical protein
MVMEENNQLKEELERLGKGDRSGVGEVERL